MPKLHDLAQQILEELSHSSGLSFIGALTMVQQVLDTKFCSSPLTPHIKKQFERLGMGELRLETYGGGRVQSHDLEPLVEELIEFYFPQLRTLE